jgi:hypothetical protein
VEAGGMKACCFVDGFSNWDAKPRGVFLYAEKPGNLRVDGLDLTGVIGTPYW